jgi:(1->4)-alpha-D-glucan 1-alpha-D-glucosylmutase
MLAELESGLSIEEITRRKDSGMPKLWVLYSALNLRRKNPEWFGADAGYTPIEADGPKKEHAVAFLRGDRVATLVPRWNVKLGGSWGGTTIDLPNFLWRNVLTGETTTGGRLRIQTLLQSFPVALFVREGN